MNIIIKTISNKKFQLENVPECTVADLKTRIAQDLDLGGNVKKLIFKGKSLKDDKTLQSYGVITGSEIVCLVRKGQKKSPAKKAAAGVSEQASSQSEQAQSGKRQYTIQRDHVMQLVQMGFPEQMVLVSLKAAYGDPKLATQYLIAGGIPADRAAALQKEYEAQSTQSAPSGSAPTQPASRVGPRGMNARFEAMLANPEQLEAIMSSPQVQQHCLQILQQEKPDLFQRFVANPQEVGESEEFTKLMFHIMHKSFQAGDQKAVVRKRIELTEEDKAALTRLQQEKSLTRQQAAQVYMKHGKDLEASMAFCDQLLEQARAQAPAPKQPAPTERRALSPRNSNIQATQSTDAHKPPAQQETTATEENTVLQISPDMLLEDDEDE